VSRSLDRGTTGAALPRPGLVSGQLACCCLLQDRVAAGAEMQVILVDVDDFYTRAFALNREGIARLNRLVVIDSAFPMAVVKLGRANEREESARVDAVDQPLAYDLNIVAELLIKIGDAAGDVRHGPKNFGIIRRVFTKRRREAFLERRHDGRAMVILITVLFFHSLGHPGRDGDGSKDPHGKGIAASDSRDGQDGPPDQNQHPELDHAAHPFLPILPTMTLFQRQGGFIFACIGCRLQRL